MSYSESDRKKKYPDNYLEVQQHEEFLREMNQLNDPEMEVNNQSQSSAPNIFCNNCNNDYKRLQLYFIILVILFLLSLLGVLFLHIDRKTIIEQNSKILTEYKHHQRLYNKHIDNTIGYIQKMIDLLIRTQGNLSNLKFDVSFDQNYVPDVIIL